MDECRKLLSANMRELYLNIYLKIFDGGEALKMGQCYLTNSPTPITLTHICSSVSTMIKPPVLLRARTLVADKSDAANIQDSYQVISNSGKYSFLDNNVLAERYQRADASRSSNGLALRVCH
jgi:hypothetical protein